MGKTILEIFKNIDFPFTCALVNNQRVGLADEVEEDSKIELLSYESSEGKRTYERSIVFVTKVALREIDPSLKLILRNSIEDSLYCGIAGNYNDSLINILKAKVEELVKRDVPIRKLNLPKEVAINRLEKEGRFEDISGIKYLLDETISIYELNGIFNYFAGPLIPSTRFLKIFDIAPYANGILLLLPASTNPSERCKMPERPKLFEIYRESSQWSEKLEINNVADINRSIVTGKIGNIIKIQEALHEIKITEIAKQIIEKKAKLVLISGPSSSGKTTFAKRLEIQLRAFGLKPFVISTDNYFVDRDETPQGEDGSPDYESPEALNINALQSNVMDLVNGNEAEIPRFNFITGKSEKWRKIRLNNNGILIIEGIHGLNPKLTDRIPDDLKFKIYVSVLTQMNIDNINRIPTRDHRLIRRIVRDSHYRGISASETIKRWQQVIKGEDNYIFPFQETADAIFNSSIIYGLPILRIYAEAPLRAIESREKEYAESLRLLKFLSHFIPLFPDEVPPNSILREFIGKSSFKY